MAEKQAPDPTPKYETPEENQLREDFKREFDAMAADPQLITLRLTKVQAWAVISQLQLAFRHPANRGPTSEIAKIIAEAIEPMIATTPALKQVAARGWLEVYDEET